MAENHALIPEPVTMYTQTEPLNEVKDLSKNLVSGDFERQYASGMMQQPSRRRHTVTVLAACIGALAVWLLVLTMVREVQIARLRQQVDDLSAAMITTNAQLKSLHQTISSNRLFNEFKALEDTIYADDDSIVEIGKKGTDKDDSSVSLEKLHDITILEDDNDEDPVDDEDLYDDDAESGDWYPDYDRRRQKIGTTNMVKLKPEDFTDDVLTFEKESKNFEHIKELSRMINEDPENPNIGFPPNPPSSPAPAERGKRSVLADATPEVIEPYTVPRAVAKTEERRKTKKYMPADSVSPLKALHAVTRTVRNSDNEVEGARRPFIAAHFHGNTSHLSPEIHEHYKGNGLVRVAHDAPHDVWYPAPWTLASPHPRPTLTKKGHVHVHHTGIYLVYVQIYYLDSHDIISWVLHRTNADIEGRETLLQCAQSSHSAEPMDKPNSCFSAAALFLKEGDRLAVRNTGGDRHSLMQSEKSFIGLIKLADAEDPEEEF